MSNTTYNVTGRYMDGQKLIGYHIVSCDGDQRRITREQAIQLIENSVIANMRIQSGQDGEIIIRGYGVNLNRLPVFDWGKNKFRNTEASQAASNSGVSISKSDVKDINAMGQFRITKRIMIGSKCIGYEIEDYSGRTMRKKRKDIMEYAGKKLIANAIVNVYEDKESGKTKIILRGIGCDLNKLPVLIVDENGRIVEPSRSRINNKAKYKVMKHSGVLIDTRTGKSKAFKFGESIVYSLNGEATVATVEELKSKFKASNDTNIEYSGMDLETRYMIKFFDGRTESLTNEEVLGWQTIELKK